MGALVMVVCVIALMGWLLVLEAINRTYGAGASMFATLALLIITGGWIGVDQFGK